MHPRFKAILPALSLFIVVLIIYLATVSRESTSTDVYGANLASWQIGTTGVPWFEELPASAYPAHPQADEGKQWAGTVANGHQVITRSPGVVALAVPAYWIQNSPTFDLAPGAITAAFLAALAALLMFLALSTRLSTRTAWIATAVFAFATPMWSVAADGMWTHTVTTLGIAGMAWAASKDRWWLTGFFGGLALFGRFHTSLIVAIVGVGIALHRRQPMIAVKVGLVSTIWMGLAIAWTRWLYGVWSPMGGYGSGYLERLDGFEPTLASKLANFAGMWVSADRGFLVWTPLALVLLPLLVRSWDSLPDWSRWLAVGGLTYTVAQSWISAFHGGDAYYGYRLSLELLASVFPAYVFACSGIWRNARKWPASLIGVIAGFQAGAISVGAVTAGVFVPTSSAWTHNALVVAICKQPLVLLWLSAFMLLGWLLPRMFAPTNAEPVTATPSIANETEQRRS